MNLLKLDNVSKSFGTVETLRSITLECRPGQVTALVGDNGAGKSTLLKLIAGIHAPDAGTLSLGPLDLTGLPAARHRQSGIEMVYQDLALARQCDVATNLYMGRELTRCGFLDRRTMRRQTALKLAELGIALPHLDQPVSSLSGGQQQAIAIARAVLFDPQVLLLDEPTAALAAREVQQTLALIKKQKEQGRIVILVSHRLNDVFEVSDRIVTMKQGQIIADDETSATNINQIIQQIMG